MRKRGYPRNFSEILELEFGKKMQYITLYFKAFKNDGCLIAFEKYLVIHDFLFGFQ